LSVPRRFWPPRLQRKRLSWKHAGKSGRMLPPRSPERTPRCTSPPSPLRRRNESRAPQARGTNSMRKPKIAAHRCLADMQRDAGIAPFELLSKWRTGAHDHTHSRVRIRPRRATRRAAGRRFFAIIPKLPVGDILFCTLS
jgi:hypothetical protein